MKLPRIAVTGLGVVCSIGRNVDDFADGLRAGRLGIATVEHADLLWSPCVIGGEVKDFEPAEVSVLGARCSRHEAFAITATAEALAQSGLDPDTRRRLRIGASIGTCQTAIGDAGEAWEDGAQPQARRYAGAAVDAISFAFGFTGPRCIASNACAAGSSAITIARDNLWSGAADVMVAGGSDSLAFFTYAGFSVLQSLDLEPCSPYGRSSGLTLGEGAGILVLETFDSARARGAPIIAELAGCGGSADGYHPTAPDPTGRGAALALRRALAQAGVDPGEVDYVNGHGTGTPANDSMERIAFRAVFGERARNVPVSSTKSMVGHTLGAAGAIEALACILAIRDGFLPPTVGMAPDGSDDFDFVPNTSRPAEVRVAASNNYAFGGSNASLVFRDPRLPAARQVESGRRRVLLTGLGTVGALGEGVAAWAERLVSGTTAIRPHEISDGTTSRSALAALAPKLDAKRYASRSDWRKMNDFERMCVASTRLALADAELHPTRQELDDTALVFATAGGALNDVVAFDRAARSSAEAASPNVFPHSAVNAAAGHVCTVLGMHGVMLSLSQGGVSSLMAIEHAAGLVARGDADIAIVLAADEVCATSIEAMALLPWRSLAEEVVRPFDERADGTAFGSASVSLVLESEEHARARGAAAYARVLGSSCVGTLAAVDDDAIVDSWTEAIDLALERSRVVPADIGYCAAAAGGIDVVDEMELAALVNVFGASIAVGAPKSMTGECLGASGAINVVTAALALRDGWLAPTANLECPRPGVRHVMGAARHEPIRHCLVDAAAPGATYACVVLGGAG